MRRLMIGLTLVGMAALIPLWVRADDRQIAQEIVQQLQKHKDTGALKGFGIDLQVEEGVVRLEGRVSTSSQQRLALDTVRRVKGVKQVVNKLTVTGKPFAKKQVAASKPVAKGAYNASLAKLKGVLGMARSTPATLASAQSEAGAAAELAEQDQEIARLVAEALKLRKESGRLKGFRVNLSVDRGTVWLEGDVASREQRLLVLDAARRIPGVKQVVNELEIRKQDPALLVSQTTEPASQPAPAAVPQVTPIPVAEVVPIPVAKVAPIPVAEIAPQVIPEAVVEAKPAAPVAKPAAPVAEKVVAVTAPAVGTAVAPQQPQGLATAPAAQLVQVPVTYQQPGYPVPMTYVAQVQPPAYVPGHAASVPSPVARTRYDHPQMPSYAWPTYASHPNYAAVTYPKQYSPTAWPYIGPFYPYPQVPLGWRKVTLEWDDGWWQLDFKNRR
ncbi:MAG: BON domain-containing protein [Pirellulaceae bacterium]